MTIQMDIFGSGQSVNTLPSADNLPRPLHDWALSLYIIANHPKGVTVFSAMQNYGMVKFQERLNEILEEHPEIVSKKTIEVPKRLNRKVRVTQYKAADIPKIIEIYMNINKKGGSANFRKK